MVIFWQTSGFPLCLQFTKAFFNSRCICKLLNKQCHKCTILLLYLICFYLQLCKSMKRNLYKSTFSFMLSFHTFPWLTITCIRSNRILQKLVISMMLPCLTKFLRLWIVSVCVELRTVSVLVSIVVPVGPEGHWIPGDSPEPLLPPECILQPHYCSIQCCSSPTLPPQYDPDHGFSPAVVTMSTSKPAKKADKSTKSPNDVNYECNFITIFLRYVALSSHISYR